MFQWRFGLAGDCNDSKLLVASTQSVISGCSHDFGNLIWEDDYEEVEITAR
jgi:hypothetical protein